MFRGVYGHSKQIDFLEKSIRSGKLAHGYVFAGPEFVGKKLVAQKFAQILLCEKNSACDECGMCKTLVAAANADFISLGSVEAIKIEEVRDLIYKLSLRPYMAKYKVAVIDNAENMTVEAQNALLKVLEEPKSYTVMILVTSNPNKLLRTILSRAQKISFGPVQADAYQDAVSGKIGSDARELIMSLALGRPGLAISIAGNEEFVEKLKQIDSDFSVMNSLDLADKLKLAYDLADLETVDLKEVLDLWLIRYENQLAATADIKTARNLSEIASARKMLDQNVNSKLLLTNLMLNLV